jgi:hypothetical protein
VSGADLAAGPGSTSEAKVRPRNPYDEFTLRGALALWKFYFAGARAGCEVAGRPLWPVFHVLAWRYAAFACRWWLTGSYEVAARRAFPGRWRKR